MTYPAIVALVTTIAGFGSSLGQAPAPPQTQDTTIPIVEVVGCLTQGANNTWLVSKATEPAPSKPGWIDAAAAKAAETQALGSRQYRLIGVAEFKPAEHVGHKVTVRGLLITDSNQHRINLTSLQMVSASCDK